MSRNDLQEAVVQYLKLRETGASSRDLERAIESMARALPREKQVEVGMPQIAAAP